MEKIRLNKEEKERVRKWLQESPQNQRYGCPFDGDSEIKDCCEICYSWFPKLRQKPGFCPCRLYKLQYVKARANQILKY